MTSSLPMAVPESASPAPDRRRGRAVPALVALAFVVVLGALVAVVIAGPQLLAMAQQASAGGAAAGPHLLAASYGRYGAQLPGLLGPSPRLSDSGLSGLAAAYRYRQPTEGVPTFGLALTALALSGLAVSWRRRGARSLAACWLGCAALALGTTLYIGGRQYVPLAEAWHGAGKGSWLTARRLLRCRPGGAHGPDPVPAC